MILAFDNNKSISRRQASFFLRILSRNERQNIYIGMSSVDEQTIEASIYSICRSTAAPLSSFSPSLALASFFSWTRGTNREAGFHKFLMKESILDMVHLEAVPSSFLFFAICSLLFSCNRNAAANCSIIVFATWAIPKVHGRNRNKSIRKERPIGLKLTGIAEERSMYSNTLVECNGWIFSSWCEGEVSTFVHRFPRVVHGNIHPPLSEFSATPRSLMT